MAVKTKEEIIKTVTELLGDRTDDEALAIIEDTNDTLNDYETRVSDSTDWKKKYEENDAKWRKTYKERFTKGASSDDDGSDPNELLGDEEKNEPPKVLRFEDLFETK